MFNLSVSNYPTLCSQSTSTLDRDPDRGLQSDWSIEALHNTCFNQNCIGANHVTTSAAINSSVPYARPAQYPELELQTHSSPKPTNLLCHLFSNHLIPDEVLFRSQSGIVPSSDCQVWSIERCKTRPNDRQPQHMPLSDAISAPQLAHYEMNQPSHSSGRIAIDRSLSLIPRPSGCRPSTNVNQYVSLS